MQIDPIFTFIRSQTIVFSSAVDSRRTFPGEIYDLLELAKIFYIGFQLRRISLSTGYAGRGIVRSAPSSSAALMTREWESMPASIFNIAPTVASRILALMVDAASLGRPSLLATLSATHRAGYRVDFYVDVYIEMQ